MEKGLKATVEKEVFGTLRHFKKLVGGSAKAVFTRDEVLSLVDAVYGDMKRRRKRRVSADAA
jgi:hypothetical protein